MRSTIDLAHNLGMTVLAEGVEDETTLDLLAQYGCDSAQGHLFSRALTAQELTPWLTESAYAAHPPPRTRSAKSRRSAGHPHRRGRHSLITEPAAKAAKPSAFPDPPIS